jgi:hypothetical protein
MDFGLSQDQVLLKDTIRRYLESECPTTRVRTIMESDTGHDPALWQGLARLGVAGLQVPAEHGGSALELLDVALAAEELGWACTPGPFLACALATAALVASGNEEAMARWLPGIAEGQAIVTFALGDEGDEWDPDKLVTRARGGALTGRKPLVPYAAIADAMLIAARDDDGPGLWLVERGAPGLEVTTLSGLRHDAAGGERRARRGPGGQDRRRADRPRSCTRCRPRAARGRRLRRRTSLPRHDDQVRAHARAVRPADRRVPGGEAPACGPGHRSRAGAVAVVVRGARLRSHPRPRRAARGHREGAPDRSLRPHVRVTTELHGGIGFTWEYDLHLWFRRAIFDQAFLGGAGYHRQRAPIWPAGRRQARAATGCWSTTFPSFSVTMRSP